MRDLVGGNLNLEEDMLVKVGSDKSLYVGAAIKEGIKISNAIPTL